MAYRRSDSQMYLEKAVAEIRRLEAELESYKQLSVVRLIAINLDQYDSFEEAEKSGGIYDLGLVEKTSSFAAIAVAHRTADMMQGGANILIREEAHDS